MSAETLISDIISNAQQLASQTVERAIGYADDAQVAAITVTDLAALPVPEKPNPKVPGFAPGTTDLAVMFTGNFDQIFNRLDPEFTTRFNALVAEFFPTVNASFGANIDNWITRAITVGGTGLPNDVENQIWERARSKEIRDFNRKDEELISNWAERGFSLPPGALFSAEQAAQEHLTEQNNTMAREIAIKQIDIQIANLRFAVEQGNRLRLGAVEAATAFARAWLDVGRIAVEYTNGLLSAQLGLYNAVTAYYNALINSSQLIYKWGEDQTENFVRHQTNFVELVKSNTAARVNAAISSAQTIGSIGASVLAAQNTMAHISNDTIIEGTS